MNFATIHGDAPVVRAGNREHGRIRDTGFHLRVGIGCRFVLRGTSSTPGLRGFSNARCGSGSYTPKAVSLTFRAAAGRAPAAAGIAMPRCVPEALRAVSQPDGMSA
jgi:hypothetical protein